MLAEGGRFLKPDLFAKSMVKHQDLDDLYAPPVSPSRPFWPRVLGLGWPRVLGLGLPLHRGSSSVIGYSSFVFGHLRYTWRRTDN
jgi:hypothetical protein